MLAVETALVSKFLPRKGIKTEIYSDILEIIMSNLKALPRPDAETDPTHKQIIPYITVCRGDEVFVMRRLKKGGEDRLHGKLSLGVGGHINPDEDGSGQDALMRGIQREIEEEVFISDLVSMTPRGVINDDTNEVGAVHLGLFYVLEAKGEVFVRETDKLEGFWLERRKLPEMTQHFETWSQFVISALC